MATVVQIATEAMFRNHFYEFGGQRFQQQEGGPIGLRGTCSVARLTMQIFDRKWSNILEDQGVDIKLYSRYMDDGRILLHPIKRGGDGLMVGYCTVSNGNKKTGTGRCWRLQWTY